MKNTTVLKAKRFGVYTCLASDTLKAAARLMNDRNISALVVVDAEGYLNGIISRIDLVRACYERPDWGDALVGDYMTAEPVTVNLDETLHAVMELLLTRHIHRVVTVAREPGGMRPVAVLSAADLVYQMASQP